MKRLTALLLLLASALAPAAPAPDAETDTQVTARQSVLDLAGAFTNDGFKGDNINAHMLLTEAYGLNDDQILGEPDWTKSVNFDVEAKVAGPDVATLKKLTIDQRRTMFQQVLADRFKLAAHHETRQLPVYVLTQAKGGAKLKESPPVEPPSADAGPATPPKPGEPRPRRGPMMMFGRGKITAQNAGLSMMITMLSRQLHRTIIDKTGLTGAYDINLQWTPDQGSGGEGSPPGAASPAGAPTATAPADSGPDLFTAIQEQLGLKLESTKGPADVLIVDHIEKPAVD